MVAPVTAQLLICEGDTNKPYQQKSGYNIEVTPLTALKISKRYLKQRRICTDIWCLPNILVNL